MPDRIRRVYRATAIYDQDPLENRTRHFLTKRSRDQWATQRREGYPERPPSTWDDDGVAAIPPAVSVTCETTPPILDWVPDE